MADVRALLAAERQSRRITHPHLSYTKSGMLLCNLCNLNIKSEALWEGHLKSANHRRNAQAGSQEPTGKGVKRKIEDVDEVQEERDEAELDARKKPKSRPESMTAAGQDGGIHAEAGPQEQEDVEVEAEAEAQAQSSLDTPQEPATTASISNPDGREHISDGPEANGAVPGPGVDEDEWAAFEREVAPLTAARPPDYSSATISAAPVTSAQLAQQLDEDQRQRMAREADDEKEEEERRLEEEFDVMEEMEERVRKLRQKREALKMAAQPEIDPGQAPVSAATTEPALPQESAEPIGDNSDKVDNKAEDEEEDDEDDDDDWYA